MSGSSFSNTQGLDIIAQNTQRWVSTGRWINQKPKKDLVLVLREDRYENITILPESLLAELSEKQREEV